MGGGAVEKGRRRGGRGGGGGCHILATGALSLLCCCGCFAPLFFPPAPPSPTSHPRHLYTSTLSLGLVYGPLARHWRSVVAVRSQSYHTHTFCACPKKLELFRGHQRKKTWAREQHSSQPAAGQKGSHPLTPARVSRRPGAFLLSLPALRYPLAAPRASQSVRRRTRLSHPPSGGSGLGAGVRVVRSE